MGAYSVGLEKPLCRICKARATHEVFNTYNSLCGRFCSRHAVQEVKRLDEAARMAAKHGLVGIQ